jgi:hypothetical protein
MSKLTLASLRLPTLSEKRTASPSVIASEAWQSLTVQGRLSGVYPLLAAGGPDTFVATKVSKKAFSRNASLPHKAFALQSRQNHGLQLFCSTSFAHFPTLQQKLAMPLQPHRACIVLPAFVRSCSAEGKRIMVIDFKTIKAAG